jgi:hypothetical protein
LSGSDDGTTFTVIDSRSSVSWASVSDVKTFTLASPANYSTYRWTLTTDANDAFAGLREVQLTAVPSASVPGVPVSVRLGQDYWTCSESNAVMWNVPSSDGGSAITGYVWRIGSGSLTSVSPSTGTSNALSNASWTGGRVVGLPTSGSFQVAAVNAAGTGSFASITLQQDCN